MSTHRARMDGLMTDSDIANTGIEQLMATILICSCSNDELKEELIKCK